MKFKHLLSLVVSFLYVSHSFAQTQATMVKSSNPQLAKNKKLVYDFWRNVFEGGHLDEAEKYMTANYIQHNPNVPTGRKAFVDFFSKFVVEKPVLDTIKAPLIAIVAENDLVILVFKQKHPDPKDASQQYETTWFDMFRIENGKIAEHWDPALKQ